MSTISFTTNSDPWGRCFCDFEGAEVNVFFVHIFSLTHCRYTIWNHSFQSIWEGQQCLREKSRLTECSTTTSIVFSHFFHVFLLWFDRRWIVQTNRCDQSMKETNHFFFLFDDPKSVYFIYLCLSSREESCCFFFMLTRTHPKVLQKTTKTCFRDLSQTQKCRVRGNMLKKVDKTETEMCDWEQKYLIKHIFSVWIS